MAGETESPDVADAADRAAFLAEMRGGETKPATSEAKPAEPEPELESAPDADEVAESTDGSEATDDADTDATDAAEGTAEADADKAKPDPDADRRLAAVQKAEQRSKDALARERQTMHAEIDARLAKLESEWAPRIKAAERFEALNGRARYNAVAVLRELGINDDDFERVAQEIYAHSKAAGVKPEHKAHAERAARERELSDELAATKKRQDKLEAELLERDRREENARAAERYFASLTKAVGDRTPLAKHLLARTPDKARARLAQIALEMMDGGTEPTPVAVLAQYERVQRAELEEMGVDPATIINGKDLSKKAPKPVVKPKVEPAKAAPAAADPDRKLTDEDERDQILRELRERREADAGSSS